MKALTRTTLSLLLCVVVFVGVCVFLTGCGESSDTENAETSQEITTQEETTTAQTQTQETVPTETKKPKKKDKYAEYKQYLSNFETVDGGGYSVIVSDELNGDDDFIEVKNCALYTMKKAYKKYKTSDMGVFGYYENGIDPAFSYDGAYGDETIYIYREDLTSPTGWQWALSPDDWKYIKGGK